jgi:hypothetical protein
MNIKTLIFWNVTLQSGRSLLVFWRNTAYIFIINDYSIFKIQEHLFTAFADWMMTSFSILKSGQEIVCFTKVT